MNFSFFTMTKIIQKAGTSETRKLLEKSIKQVSTTTEENNSDSIIWS